MMARARQAAVTALLALGAARLDAQTADGVVRGAARDQRTGDPEARATIRVTGPTIAARTAITGDDGRYSFRLAPGPASLRITALGYQAQRVEIAVRAGETTDVALAMVVVPLRLGVVRIEAQTRAREEFERSPDVGAFPLAGSTLQSLPVIGEADVLRTAQLLPGVTTRSDYTAGYNVRGGESDQNLVLLDGIPVYNPFHLGGLFGTFIDETVADLNLLTGAFPASYGGRLSSVLDVTSQDESRQGVHGAASLSLLAGSVALGGSFPNTTTAWGIAARRTETAKNGNARTMVTVPLSELAHARSGDKGDMSNIGVIARAPEIYPWLVATLSAKRVKKYFAGIALGDVQRHEVPNLWALNFLLAESLGGGGTVSLRLDAQGKTLSHALLAMTVQVPRALIACARRGDNDHRSTLGLKRLPLPRRKVTARGRRSTKAKA